MPVWTAVVQQDVRSTPYVAGTAESQSVVTMSIVVRAQHMWPEMAPIRAELHTQECGSLK